MGDMERIESILIVDDEDTIRRLLDRKLSSEGYECHVAANGEQALDIIRKNPVGLVILDIKMPGKSGIQLLPQIKAAYPETQILMATTVTDIETAVNCMKDGAYDYITKPINLDEMAFAVSRALDKRKLELQIRDYQHHLEERVLEQAEKIRSSFLRSITALATALEAKDRYTAGHSQRVAEIAVAIARAMGLLEETNEKIQLAGLVHDVGKIGIRESILNKPGYLTDEELCYIQKHPEMGQRILTPLSGDEEVSRTVRAHHEHYDGTGYPDGLRQNEIPLGSRIIAVADAYEAMTSNRPYREAMNNEAALVEIERGGGTHFDPEVAEVFLRTSRNIRECSRYI